MYDLLYCGIGLGYQELYHQEISYYEQILNTESGKNKLLEAKCGLNSKSIPLGLELKLNRTLGETHYDGYLMNGEPHIDNHKSKSYEFTFNPYISIPYKFSIEYRLSIGEWTRDLNDYTENYSTKKHAIGIGWRFNFKNDYNVYVFFGKGNINTKLRVNDLNFDSTLNRGNNYNFTDINFSYKNSIWLNIENESWSTDRTQQDFLIAPKTESKRTNISIGKSWFF